MRFLRKNSSNKNNELFPEEVLIDGFGAKETPSLEIPLKRGRIFLLMIGFGILVLFIFIQLFELQVINHSKYKALAYKNQYIVASVLSERGVIYDRNFKQLVFNKISFDLKCTENILSNTKEQKVLFELFGIQIPDKQKEWQETLKKNLDYKERLVFLSSQEELPDCKIEKKIQRDYKDGEIFAHILGYWRESEQATGLEKYYNSLLSSKKGEIIIERDAKGRIIREKVKTLPQPGRSLLLYLDSELQKRLYQAMKDQMKKFGAKKGVAVAMDPKTGGILAMVSLPSFDNNLFSQGITQEEWEKLSNDPNFPLLNRVIQGLYPTGSVIKPLLAASALQEGIITPFFTLNCLGRIVVDNPWFPDKPFIFNDWKTHGIVDVKKAIAESCNVFFYVIGGGYKDFKGLGVERIKKYLHLFGWGEKLGIDLPGEKQGFIPDPAWKKKRFKSPNNIWYPGDTYNLSIGQGYIGITPLEVTASFSALVNGGKLLKPRLVKAILDENKNIVEEFKPEIIREGFIEKKYLEIVKEGMRETVTYGTATLLNDLPVPAGAKTGTAQTSKEGYYHNWLVVFAPVDDPQIVLTLMVEEVKGMHVVVAPVAKEILTWYFTR